MEITIFARKVTANNGKTFFVYSSRLTKKDGTEQPVRVHFREDCGMPESFPCNIQIEKTDCNLKKELYSDKEGNEQTSYHLWIKGWKPGSKYVDRSMDEYF